LRADNRAFRDFDKQFRDETQDYVERSPTTYAIMNHYLRTKISGRPIDSLLIHRSIFSMVPKAVMVAFWKALILVQADRRATKVFVSISRFKYLEKRVAVSVIASSSVFRRSIYFFINYVAVRIQHDFLKLELSDDTYKRSQCLEKIECFANSAICSLSWALKKNRINVVVTQDAHSCTGALLALGARKQNIQVIEIAHGLLLDPLLITCFPTEATKHLVWNEGLDDDLNRLATEYSLRHVQYSSYGWFVERCDLRAESVKDQADLPVPDLKSSLPTLVLLNQLRGYDEVTREKFRLAAQRFEKKLIRLEVEYVFRRHPSDIDNGFTGYLCSDRFDQRRIDQIIDKYSSVVGAPSSLMCFFSVNGTAVCQIREMSLYPCITIPLEGIESYEITSPKVLPNYAPPDSLIALIEENI